MSKKPLIILITVVLLCAASFFLYSPVLFQEGNPWPQIKGIVQLTFSNADMIRLSGSDTVYMTKSENAQEIIKNFMEDKEYEFTEQMGAGYFFKSSTGESAVATHKYYSRYYSLWRITETNKSSGSVIAEELKDCLPKSDMESHSRCSELLAAINTFDDCVSAGFPILKSNPPQCAIPDGRIFVQDSY
jgi:hypothetical protein